MSSSIRKELIGLLTKYPAGHLDHKVRCEFAARLQGYAESDDVDSSDVIFAIGKKVFNVNVVVAKSCTKTNIDNTKCNIVDFTYMKQFMKDVFISYGCTDERAETCSDVLIEADKRGIDSHGLGRLKSIYCDRMDNGILWPDRPIEIIKETKTTAFVDGNLGIGLYIGPYCMNLAIEKAKKHGVGFVVAKNSTHYGIAGYYSTMATDAGCVGLTGTNARPSLAPTFGVEPMLGKCDINFNI